VDLRIARIAERQEAVITYDQLREVGLKPGAIRHRKTNGRLFEAHYRVYAVGRPDLTPLGELWAALLRCGEGARLTRWSATAYAGMTKNYTGPIQISVPRTPPKVKGLDVREATLHPYDVRHKDGLAYTSPAMTLIDLAPELDDVALAELFQKATRIGLTANQIARTLARYPRRRGTPRVRAQLERYREQKGRSRGDFEDAVWVWLTNWLPPEAERPKRNQLVEVADGELREGDAIFSKAKVWLEFDFHGHHGASAKTATADHQRDRLIRDAGWNLTHYTDYEFDNDRDGIKADIERKLGLS
jgi:hypothetical protein